MTPRERAQARLRRHVPDFSHWERRDPARRVADRDREADHPEIRVPGSSIQVRDGKGPVRALPAADPSPNAPLLMRIVRDPYALEPGRYERVRWLPEPEADPAEAQVRVAEVVREKREALRRSRPVREIDHRPRHRPHPFGKVRERGEGS